MKNLKEMIIEQDDQAVIAAFFQEHPELDYIAARNRIVEFIRPLRCTPDTLARATVLLAMPAMTAEQMAEEAEARRQAELEANQKEFADLVEEIVHGAKRSVIEEQQLRKMLAHYDLDSLRQRAINMRNEKRWRSTPTSELKEQVRAAAPKPPSRYQELPPVEELSPRDIIRMTPTELRAAFSRFGSDAITARLQGRA